MQGRSCPSCDAPLSPTAQTCDACGEALSFSLEQEEVACAVCGAGMGAFEETCPSCGEKGYPALRPRRGRHFKGAPPEAGRDDPPSAASGEGETDG